MIQISRLLAHQLRSVFRKLASRSTSSIAKVSVTTGPSGLQVRLHRTDILAEYHMPGELPKAEVFLPLQALADFESRSDESVTFDTVDAGIVQARWNDSGVPQMIGYEAEDKAKLPAFPALPETMSPVEPGFLRALAEASQSTSSDNIRYATNNIQLKGGWGAIVATDGHQLLRIMFDLPWKNDVLIPSSSIFGSKEFWPDEPALIGKTDNHVAIQSGPWTLYLPIDKEGRFPNVGDVIPKPENAIAHCHLDPDDAEFLSKALARLPGADDENSPITLDLNGQVIVRAKAAGQEQTVELVLARSEATGKAVRTAIDRQFLSRGIHLGLTDFHVSADGKPLLFKDEKHDFVVMPLVGPALVAAPCDKAVQIKSVLQTEVNNQPQPIRRNTVSEPISNDRNDLQTASNGNGNGNGTGTKNRTRKPKSSGLFALIEEAESLKGALREICSRSHKLLVSLKRHRKQTRLMQTSLKAIKDLQQIDA
jgi:hypothetical protein